MQSGHVPFPIRRPFLPRRLLTNGLNGQVVFDEPSILFGWHLFVLRFIFFGLFCGRTVHRWKEGLWIGQGSIAILPLLFNGMENALYVGRS